MEKLKNEICLEDEQYDNILLSSISKLDGYSYLCGKEGKVYFVDDNFVIKSYFEPVDNLELFDNYCQEIKSYHDMGLSVPDVYSWHCVPVSGKQKGYLCYILEERISGNRLFVSEIKEIYSNCKDFCTKKQFLEAVNKKKQNPELFERILEQYLIQFIETNKKLLYMTDENLEKFIESIYKMYAQSLYGVPDVFSDNIIFDGKLLTIVDNLFVDSELKDFRLNEIKIKVIKDIFYIFNSNSVVGQYVNSSKNFKIKFKRLKEVNDALCLLAMKKFIRKANQVINPVFRYEFEYLACYSVGKKIFGAKKAKELMKEINIDLISHNW